MKPAVIISVQQSPFFDTPDCMVLPQDQLGGFGRLPGAKKG